MVAESVLISMGGVVGLLYYKHLTQKGKYIYRSAFRLYASPVLG